jgi:recombinational DNA repair protein RecT
LGNKGPIVGVYALAVAKSGAVFHEEMGLEEVLEHKRKFVKAQNGPYANNQNDIQYGLKTVMRRLINRKLDMTPKLAEMLTSTFSDEIELETEDDSLIDCGADQVDTTTGEIIETDGEVSSATPTPEPLASEEPQHMAGPNWGDQLDRLNSTIKEMA